MIHYFSENNLCKCIICQCLFYMYLSRSKAQSRFGTENCKTNYLHKANQRLTSCDNYKMRYFNVSKEISSTFSTTWCIQKLYTLKNTIICVAYAKPIIYYFHLPTNGKIKLQMQRKPIVEIIFPSVDFTSLIYYRKSLLRDLILLYTATGTLPVITMS